MLIARNHNNRIRIDRHNRRGDRQRGASRLRTSQNSRVGVLLSIVVNNFRSVIDGGSGGTFHQDTISVPSINFTLDIAIGRNSRDSDLTTVTNVHLGKTHRSNDRDRIDIYSNNIGFSLTTRGLLQDVDMIVVRTSSRCCHISESGSARNYFCAIHPHINQFVSIPIVERGGQSSCTTFTKNSVRNRNVHNRSGIDIHLSFSSSATSIIIHNLYGEAVRIISVRFRE